MFYWSISAVSYKGYWSIMRFSRHLKPLATSKSIVRSRTYLKNVEHVLLVDNEKRLKTPAKAQLLSPSLASRYAGDGCGCRIPHQIRLWLRQSLSSTVRAPEDIRWVQNAPGGSQKALVPGTTLTSPGEGWKRSRRYVLGMGMGVRSVWRGLEGMSWVEMGHGCRVGCRGVSWRRFLGHRVEGFGRGSNPGTRKGAEGVGPILVIGIGGDLTGLRRMGWRPRLQLGMGADIKEGWRPHPVRRVGAEGLEMGGER